MKYNNKLIGYLRKRQSYISVVFQNALKDGSSFISQNDEMNASL